MNPRRGLALVVAAQWLGALADGALILVAIQLLDERGSPAWTVPALRITFYVAYVLLAPFAGAAADAWPKQRVLVVTGSVKLAGCALLLAGVHPLAAYGFIGLGAVAHAPARYGILAELVPSSRLVTANGWMEAATVAGSLLGIALAGALLASWWPGAGPDGSRHAAAVLAFIYLAALMACVPITAQGPADPRALRRPAGLVSTFGAACGTLANDRQALLAVATTSLFWSTAAVLQFLVLRWAADRLGLHLSGAAMLQVVFAAGLIAGAATAGRWVSTSHALRMLPLGVVAGSGLLLLAFTTQRGVAAAVLALVGLASGVLLVPMNALLQVRGAPLVQPGQAIAAQHFAENVASIALLAAYGLLTVLDVPVRTCMAGLGLLVAGLAMLLWLAARQPARGPDANEKAARGRPST
jgi:LPLT family lysophospholipid transporter-like MFS transporter